MDAMTERDKIAHLLRRFGLGASVAEVEYYGKEGLKGAIDKLLDVSADEGFPYAPEKFAPRNNVQNPRVAQVYWYSRLIITQTPLREKLTLFWHDHFATSAQKVDSGPALTRQIETIRQNALGRFEDMLVAVTRDPAMIYWLDNQLNKKGRANENFAREVMELFTLGVGNYTEKDIQEAARAFTGWGYGLNRRRQSESVPRGPMQFVFNEQNHDEGSKTVLGNTGEWTGDDVCAILAGSPRTAWYIAWKMWSWFAYPEPEAKLIDRLAKAYRDSGLKTSVLVRAIMEAPEFYSEKCVRAQYKNPIDFCVSMARQLGMGQFIKTNLDQADESEQLNRAALLPATLIQTSTKSMGMELLYPPDVAGWDGGEAWISSATMVERMKFADKLFGGRGAGGIQLLQFATTADGMVDKLIEVFDAPMPPAKVKNLRDAALKASGGSGTLTARNVGPVCIAVCRLMFGSPEFQFC